MSNTSDATALMIIDVQQAMFAEEFPVYQGSELLKTLGGLIARARQAGVPVIYVLHCEQAGQQLDPDGPGFPVHPAIAPQPGDGSVRKYHPDSFQDTTLLAQLEQLGVKNLVIAGIQTEMCVDTTCRRAYSLGYAVTLVKDGHSTWNNSGLSAAQIIAHHNETLSMMFARLQLADEVQFAGSE
jgi:nicotinamidase-related amidase